MTGKFGHKQSRSIGQNKRAVKEKHRGTCLIEPLTSKANASISQKTMNTAIDNILSTWFGTLDAEGRAEPQVRSAWFKKDPEFDQRMRDQFGELHKRAIKGELEDWLTDSRGRLAYIILLDQLSRNMYRNTKDMYAGDEQALSVAKETIASGKDRSYRFAERGFLYLPLMHSEALSDQERCIELYKAFALELEGEKRKEVEMNVDYAIRHRDIVARFGRFPHRNEILGRPSTPEELEFLKMPGSGF